MLQFVKLKLNVAKTKEIIFRRPNAWNVLIPRSVVCIDSVKHAKLLSVVIDDCLSFSPNWCFVAIMLSESLPFTYSKAIKKLHQRRS